MVQKQWYQARWRNDKEDSGAWAIINSCDLLAPVKWRLQRIAKREFRSPLNSAPLFFFYRV